MQLLSKCKEDYILIKRKLYLDYKHLTNTICITLTDPEKNCLDLKYPGTIIFDSRLVSKVGYNPPIIYQAREPWGGSGKEILYQWQEMTNGQWQDNENASEVSFDPDALKQNTCYRLGARHVCSTKWFFSKEICFTIINSTGRKVREY